MSNTIRSNIRYTDIRTNLDAHPVRKDIALLSNEEAVKRSIRNLIWTNPYERFFDPKKGAGIKQFLFENIDQITSDTVKGRIKSTLETYEKRAEILEVNVEELPDDNAINITVVFSLLNNPNPVILETILYRIR